ncbi:hypothetical protein ALC53_10828 [Atta colombica]|uniref:Uncharacterized protein n=1 Tax=Atta colombica TaxID=520822 RepID=A0A195B3K2_9HYME|nr:hypothetical protein ALC53_10828 [Atta colombica]
MIGFGGVQEELPSLPILLYIANEASFSLNSVGVIEDMQDLALGGNHARKNGGVIKYGQKKDAVGTELGSTEVEMVEYARISYDRTEKIRKKRTALTYEYGVRARRNLQLYRKKGAMSGIFIALDLTSRRKSKRSVSSTRSLSLFLSEPVPIVHEVLRSGSFESRAKERAPARKRGFQLGNARP